MNTKLNPEYIPSINASPEPTNTVGGKRYRITVVTDRLFRIERDKEGVFLDAPTQRVWRRAFDKVQFKTELSGSSVIITTDRVKLIYYPTSGNYKVFQISADGVLSKPVGKRNVGRGNLKGTRRTLDGAFGAVKLGSGVISKRGVAEFDDSDSLVLDADGMLKRREGARNGDVYVFAYGIGAGFTEAVSAFFRMTGDVPLLPRFALGNWWSRYWEYTDSEYLALIKKFEDNDVPFSVATIDMDWHITDISKKYGKGWARQSGWTGYTWNRELFKDPKAFLKNLKDLGYKTTLNLHPADGCRAYEEPYEKMAEAMGVTKNGEKIAFDLTNPQFINAYFEFLHRPLEREGVDFWWIDWQQGKKSKLQGLDPLWLLNHYHTLDSARNGKRPLILSRYAGPGSHRYQIGFSGDSHIGWKMLNFMPYFTSAAANIGFTWWSHDIGGHHFGKKDGELYLRWLQHGVFGPILRLHSTKSKFIDKDPFKYRPDIRDIAIRFLRLRRELIPYLYTMNYLTNTRDLPIVRPLYYEYDSEECYKKKYRNVYLFGTELLVAPITKKADGRTCSDLAYADALLPDGVWTDIFTGFEYGRETAFKDGRPLGVGLTGTRMARPLDSIPVLAKRGAILPLNGDRGNGVKNPETLIIRVFPGADNAFTLYEDDGESDAYKSGSRVKTAMSLTGGRESFVFNVSRPDGDLSLIPEKREYKIEFVNLLSACVSISIDGAETGIAAKGRDACLFVEAPGGFEITVNVKNAVYREFDKKRLVYSAMEGAEYSVTKKAREYKKWEKSGKYTGRLKTVLKEFDSVLNAVKGDSEL